ncbi:MAG TPA: RNA-binding S4 domain-containing protein [Thermoanaerobaculia bacterium]
MTSNSEPPLSVRLDVWLDVACLFPTRSQAKAACDGGKVEVNGSRGKPHREIRVGDRLTVTRGPGLRSEILVRGLAERSIPKAEARQLYEDVTPAPPPEMVEARRLDRMMAPRQGRGKPDRRERQERRKRKGW